MSKKRKKPKKNAVPRKVQEMKTQYNVAVLTDLTPNEKGKIVGLMRLNDVVLAAFHLSPQLPETGLAYRGTVSVINPENNRRMEYSAAQLMARTRKANQLQRQNGGETERTVENKKAFLGKDVRIKDSSPEAIEAALVKAGQRLCAENALRLANSAEKVGVVQFMRFSVAVDCYWHGFACKQTCGQDTVDKYRQRLHRMGGILGAKPMSGLNQADMENLKSILEKNCIEYFRIGNRFWNYMVRQEGAALPDSPFLPCLSGKEAKTDSRNQREKKKDLDTVSAERLSAEEEAVLDQLLLDHVEDGELIGLMLCKEALLIAADACALRWDDCIFDEDGTVRIKYRLKDKAWAGLDMTFVCNPVLSKALVRRKAWVESQLKENQRLGTLPVATEKTHFRKPLKSDRLNQVCWELLKDTECYGAMAPNRKKTRKPGVTLLHRTTIHRMKEEYRMENDPGLLDFLGHHRPKSVLDKFYRGYTDLAGIYRTKVMMGRDCRVRKYLTEEEKEIRENLLENGGREVTVPAVSADHCNKVTVRVRLPKGTEMKVSAAHGVKLKVKSVK